MKEFLYRVTKIHELTQQLEQFSHVCPKEHGSILAMVFTSNTDPIFHRQLSVIIKAEVPAAAVVGMTTSGEVYDGELSLESTVVAFLVFEKAEVTIKAYDCQTMTAADAGADCVRTCQDLPDLAGLCIVGTLKSLDAKPFLNEISRLPDEVPVFGGGADAYTPNEATCVFTNNQVMAYGIIAIAFTGADLHIQLGTNFGWRPMGQSMMITAMDGPLVIKELEYKPAISVYEKYLNIKRDDSFYTDIVEFPVFVERNGRQLARLPVAFRDDGALVFAADFELGEQIRLSYGDPTEIFSSSRATRDRIAQFQPQGLLIFTCITRRVFLGTDVNMELKPYQGIAPSAGAYTYGEITCMEGQAETLNILFIAVGFREGRSSKAVDAVCLPAEDQPDFKTLSLVQRLVRFINATTEELEEANRRQEDINQKLEDVNRKLLKLARQDRLTELYNRGEITAILDREAVRMCEEGLPLSAIIIDLDNFKLINDTYGHAMGDKVLKVVAKSMMLSIRAGDYAGRWGGEEFLILLPGAQLSIAEMVAERIRLCIEGVSVLPDGKHITGSFGVSQLKDDETVDEFYQRIDEALYKAKHAGKNCICTNE